VSFNNRIYISNRPFVVDASGAELRDGDGSFVLNNEFRCGDEREGSVSVTCEEGGDDDDALFEWWKTQEESID